MPGIATRVYSEDVVVIQPSNYGIIYVSPLVIELSNATATTAHLHSHLQDV